MEDTANPGSTIETNLSQALAFTMAKVSPLLRRAPSPLSSGSPGGGNTSSSSGISTGNRSDQFLSPSVVDGVASSSDAGGRGKSPNGDEGTFLEATGQSTGTGGALSKSPSGSDVLGVGKSKGKVPTQGKKKSKSWYSVFYPSYKSRSADFRKLFKEVPDDERLLVGERTSR